MASFESHRLCFSTYPAHNVVKLPNLSPTMETGTVVSWAKNEGDEVAEGDLLAEIETDKATMSFEASDAGYLAKILAPTGTKDIPVGSPLCIIVADASSVAAFKEYVAPEGSAPPAPKPVAKPEPPAPPPAASAPPASSPPKPVMPSPKGAVSPPPTAVRPGQRVFVSPLARKLAAERGVDVNQLAGMGSGTGIRGMFRASDVANLQPTAAGVPLGDFREVSISSSRSVMIGQMADAHLSIPHYYLTVDIDVDAVLKMRDDINVTLQKRDAKESTDATQISLTDILVKAVAVTCLKVPECNSSWQGDFIRQYNTVDVNVSVSTPAGLVNPIVFGAQSKGLLQINREVSALVDKATSNTLQPQEFEGGTFTLSNLGMFGISSFSAIISPPQVCLLAVGHPRLTVCPDPQSPTGFKTTHMMSCTLCCDHRVVDGAVGANWLTEFKSAIEKPALMLA